MVEIEREEEIWVKNSSSLSNWLYCPPLFMLTFVVSISIIIIFIIIITIIVRVKSCANFAHHLPTLLDTRRKNNVAAAVVVVVVVAVFKKPVNVD